MSCVAESSAGSKAYAILVSMAKQGRNPKSALPTLDLHAHRMEGLEDTVDRFITQSQNKGITDIRIMTGKGSGQVKAAVQKYLKLGGYPFHFERVTSGVNEGVLVVSI